MNDVSGKMSSVVVSMFTSMFTVNTLYTYSSQKELWVAIFIVIELFIIVLQRLVTKCCYSRAQENDIDQTTLYRFTVILHLTVTFIIVKLVLDIFSFLIAITILEWYDYINILSVVLFFIMVIFARLELPNFDNPGPASTAVCLT